MPRLIHKGNARISRGKYRTSIYQATANTVTKRPQTPSSEATTCQETARERREVCAACDCDTELRSTKRLRTAQSPVSRSQCPVPSLQCPVSSVQFPVLSVQCPVPSLQFLVLSAQVQVPSLRFPDPSVQCPVPSLQCPEPSIQFPVSSAPSPVSVQVLMFTFQC